jgi:hypothetical protein
VPLRREKRLALPWQALQQSKGFDTFLPAVDAKELEEAPGFEHDRWPTRAAPQWRRDVAERSWEQATRGSARSMGMRAMPASVWEWPGTGRRVALLLRRCPIGRRHGVSPRRAGRRACTDTGRYEAFWCP